MFSTDHLMQGSLLMKPSFSHHRRHCAHRLLSCWDTSTSPNICWESSTGSCRQCRTVLQCMEDNFLSQVIDSPARGEAILGLMSWLSKLNGDVKMRGSLECTDHALVEFAGLRDMDVAKSKVRPLEFMKRNFQTFKEIVNRIPWETSLRNKGVK